MASLNKVMIIGHLGRDPEVKYTQGGMAVCQLSIATTEKWKDKQSGQAQEQTEWHRVVAWNKQAENCGNYLRKGSQVYVEGKLQTRQYEKDGQKHYATEIVAHTVTFLGSAGNGGQSHGQKQGGYQQQPGYGQQPSYTQQQQQQYGGGPSGGHAQDDIPF